MKEVYLYKKLDNQKVQCQNCAHYCVIRNNARGLCGVKENQNGKFYALNYSKVVALNIDPIEKKPLFHFQPGSLTLSLAAAGCNFQCLNCQNWQISQEPRIKHEIKGEAISPEEIITIALEKKLPSISYTYTEPTIFSEFALDIMKIAKEKGIKNIWVSNGFWSKELFNLISPYLDAVNIDLKSFSKKFYLKYVKGKLKPVLENLIKIKNYKKHKIWLEITTLIIPSLNDSPKELKEIANFIKQNLGPETPWHISRFSSQFSWKLKNLPDTPEETLIKTYEIGKETGLNYVYIGNAPHLFLENTHCPKCKQKIIQRNGYQIKRFDKNGHCPYCGEKIDLVI